MIPDLLLEIIGLLVTGLTAILPDVELPFMADVLAGAGYINSKMHAFNTLLPMAQLLVFYRWVAITWLPAFITFTAVKWIWSHVPFLGGS
jgi:hypothetical protein